MLTFEIMVNVGLASHTYLYSFVSFKMVFEKFKEYKNNFDGK
jgi:hypothetical protein